MKENYKKETFTIVLLLFLVLLICIVYTLVSSNIKKDYIGPSDSGSIWNVGFVENSVIGNNDTEKEITIIDNNPNKTEKSNCGSVSLNYGTFAVTDGISIKPGAKCIYKLNIKNSGQIDAKLTNITMTAPDNVACIQISESCFKCGDLEYRLSNDLNGLYDITIGNIINTQEIKTMYLIIHNQSNGSKKTPVIQKNAKFTLIYNQV